MRVPPSDRRTLHRSRLWPHQVWQAWWSTLTDTSATADRSSRVCTPSKRCVCPSCYMPGRLKAAFSQAVSSALVGSHWLQSNNRKALWFD